jgi:regulator of cell morphogenesis and NO signaling
MTSVDTSATLGDLVTADARRARVLERFDLDYCCNGHRTLTEAATDKGLDPAEVASALTFDDAPPPETTLPLEHGALAHDIVDTHHAWMWEEMPRLQALVDKVHRVHGERHPELAEVKEAYTAAVAGLEPHMTTEERKVFPAITRMERTRTRPEGGSLAGPIDELRREHDEVGDLFRRINQATNTYAIPADACASFTAMLQGLQAMERDLHEHIHKENNVLFPRVLELEESLSEAGSA